MTLKKGHFLPFWVSFTKVKQKFDSTNKCRENLRINNLNLRFHICKRKEWKVKTGALALQTQIYRIKSLQRVDLAI
jgi:hypothetical protein